MLQTGGGGGGVWSQIRVECTWLAIRVFLMKEKDHSFERTHYSAFFSMVSHKDYTILQAYFISSPTLPEQRPPCRIVITSILDSSTET